MSKEALEAALESEIDGLTPEQLELEMQKAIQHATKQKMRMKDPAVKAKQKEYMQRQNKKRALLLKLAKEKFPELVKQVEDSTIAGASE
jgi:hypothetical protein